MTGAGDDAVRDAYNAARQLVNEQAEDDGLWFVAETAAEAYLQQELRRLHHVIETGAEPWVDDDIYSEAP